MKDLVNSQSEVFTKILHIMVPYGFVRQAAGLLKGEQKEKIFEILGDVDMAARSLLTRLEEFKGDRGKEMLVEASGMSLVGKLKFSLKVVKNWGLVEAGLFRFMLMNFWEGRFVVDEVKDELVEEIGQELIGFGALLKFWKLLNVGDEVFKGDDLENEYDEVMEYVEKMFEKFEQIEKKEALELGLVVSALTHIIRFQDSPLMATIYQIPTQPLERAEALNTESFTNLLTTKVLNILQNPLSSENAFNFTKGYLSVYGCRILENVGEVFDHFTTRRLLVHRGAKAIQSLINTKHTSDSFIFDTGAEFILTSFTQFAKILISELCLENPTKLKNPNIPQFDMSELNIHQIKMQRLLEAKKLKQPTQNKKSKILKKTKKAVKYIKKDYTFKTATCYLTNEREEDLRILYEKLEKANRKVDQIDEEYDYCDELQLYELDEKFDKAVAAVNTIVGKIKVIFFKANFFRKFYRKILKIK